MEIDEVVRHVNRIYTRLAARRNDVYRFEEYHDGIHPLNFATEEWRKANSARYSGFSDNWCATVVNAEAERLGLIGISGGEQKLASSLWDDLLRNEFDAEFGQGVVTSLTTSRSFVMVWMDSEGRPLVTMEHPAQVEIEYDWENPRVRKFALKTWIDEKFEYATFYTKGFLYKLQRPNPMLTNDQESQAKQGRPSSGLSSDGWVLREENPVIPNILGDIPIVEIPNRPKLRRDPISEIAGVVPMQDAINLLWAYLFLAADHASMPARVLFAQEMPKIPLFDKEGKVVGSKIIDIKEMAEKRFLGITDPNAKLDEWTAANLSVFTDVIEIAVGHIAAQTRTPPHYLVANKGLSNLPADALKAAEIGLTKKAKEFAKFANPPLREVLRLIALARGDKGAAELAGSMKIVWENPEIRSEAQLTDSLLKKSQMGYPFEYLLELDGNSPSDITRIMNLREKEMLSDPILGAVRDFEDMTDATESSSQTVPESPEG